MSKLKKYDHLVKFRQMLHMYPEISGSEVMTAKKLIDYLQEFNPDKVISGIGGNGVVVVFKGYESGPTVLLRCEMDALPIKELNDYNYCSMYEEVAHKCGHDGHMSIMAGVAEVISKKRQKSGKVILLFQPAEETGKGSKLMINDTSFMELHPDWTFALHNIPGYPMNSIIVRSGSFAAASVGAKISLTGRISHAGEPEKGINPALAVADIIKEILAVPKKRNLFKDTVLVTIVHIQLGKIDFGTSAGYAELRATLRAFNDNDLGKLQQVLSNMVSRIARQEKLHAEIYFDESFPALINDEKATNIIREVANKNNLNLIELTNPFRWSEDFSNILNISKGAMFGLGAGIHTPELHNPYYDIPDQIIPVGINILTSIIYRIQNFK